MKALVIGGNRFFGRRLVQRLLREGNEVTVMNRGRLPNVPGAIDLQCDRLNPMDLKNKTQNLKWDMIFDQIGMTADDAEAVNEILIPKAQRYIMISSQSVYGMKADLTENDFDPYTYEFTERAKVMKDYAESKRQLEAVLLQHKSSCLVSTVRLPFIVGLDDYTHRLKMHVERIWKEEPIYFPNINARFSLIQSSDAARCVYQLASTSITGPINFASKEPVPLKHLIETIETLAGKKAHLPAVEDKDNRSPYGIESDWFMSVEKAEKNGLACEPIEAWLKPLLKDMLEQVRKI